MLVQIVTENGQKKVIPLTADAGAGNPVGTVIVVCSNQIPSNYLPLGTQYDTSLYPVLYALLGTDTTPTASALGLPTLTSGQYAIKATSGLSENAQDNVINTLNEQRSYSTEEHLTGKKWIDGKPIYKKTLTGNVTENVTSEIDIATLNIADLPNVEGAVKTGGNIIPFGYGTSSADKVICFYNSTTGKFSVQSAYAGSFYVTIEYTKTN